MSFNNASRYDKESRPKENCMWRSFKYLETLAKEGVLDIDLSKNLAFNFTRFYYQGLQCEKDILWLNRYHQKNEEIVSDFQKCLSNLHFGYEASMPGGSDITEDALTKKRYKKCEQSFSNQAHYLMIEREKIQQRMPSRQVGEMKKVIFESPWRFERFNAQNVFGVLRWTSSDKEFKLDVNKDNRIFYNLSSSFNQINSKFL